MALRSVFGRGETKTFALRGSFLLTRDSPDEASAFLFVCGKAQGLRRCGSFIGCRRSAGFCRSEHSGGFRSGGIAGF